jgi:hypothetical protein
MPAGAKVVKVGTQDGGLFLWALVNTANPVEPRNFKIFPTGIDISFEIRGYDFIDSIFDGPFVWHVYQESEY